MALLKEMWQVRKIQYAYVTNSCRRKHRRNDSEKGITELLSCLPKSRDESWDL